MPAALSRFGTLAEFGSTLLARWPIVELALGLEIKTKKTYLRPLEFFLKKDLHGKLISLPVSRFVYGHAMFVGNSQKDRGEIFIFSALSLSMSGLSLARFKITADILIAFAGEVVTEEIEDTESLCCSN